MPRWPRRVGSSIAGLWGPPPTGWHYGDWAPDYSGKVWSGQHVMTGLVESIEAHVDNTWRSRQYPIVIGCAPWVSDAEVCEALRDVPTCMVIGKPDLPLARSVRDLAAGGTPVHKTDLSGLNLLALPTEDGSAPIGIAGDDPPPSVWDDHDLKLGPVRVAGYRKQHPKQNHPLVHAKVVVFAYGGEFPDAGPMGEDWAGVIPTSVWWGSANFTKPSRTSHLEFATWTSDPALTRAAWSFVTEIIAFSERLSDEPPIEPRPELVDAVDPWANWEPSSEDLLGYEDEPNDDE
jgi:hypothetical protein